ncbi:MAG TPA: adenylate/guanylate cyclase domain-containing protein [Spirochaetota bacterium]|jgi:class 3 adenylate cyclase|nr:adenylate/guanylate cyclase domain-containing protein [Spirochaetota bacterium]HPY87872.1 adenylate/guanylate cyclase domain-containing protein [Spirochaetota bacterium]HQB60636.1 adenylate/guanylate cyclase domain-containing protein [Spirochaetota bacterium]
MDRADFNKINSKEGIFMYKIVYVGNKKDLDINEISDGISKMSSHRIDFVVDNSLENITGHFFDEKPLILLIIEEDVEDKDDVIFELKNDETFKYLPIIIVLDAQNISNRKKYLTMGIDIFLNYDFDVEEFILVCNSAIKNKIRLDETLKQLGEVSEKNITKAIQLDLLRKFIPMTVWEKTEDLAENQDFEIPEEEQELAIIFADLESFTTRSEQMRPAEVIQMLNCVFEIATKVIYKNCGDIDKFIGDAFFAVFKYPEKAALSAISIQEELAKYNEERKSKGMFPTYFRMGLHYGKVIRGSVGGNERYDNTLIGDPINTTQRLESMSVAGGVLCSKEIITQIKSLNSFDFPYKNFVLKGKGKEIAAFDLFEYHVKTRNLKDVLTK